MTGNAQQLPQCNWLDDGRRLHLHHGPIDLIIEANGPGREGAFNIAVSRFQSVLDELVGELTLLREPCQSGRIFESAIAIKMQDAVKHFLPKFITPMAAVAGAVADEMIGVMSEQNGLDKIYVNNGGDAAFYLGHGQKITAAIAGHIPATIQIQSSDPYRGIATSGWRGRSQSLGIADTVSVVANNCAIADAAATMIANAVNLPAHRAISRMPAFDILPDSDLKEQLVTTAVGKLDDEDIARALHEGEKLAKTYLAEVKIGGAILMLKNQTRQIGGNNLYQNTLGELADA